MDYILKDPITLILIAVFFMPIILGFINITSTKYIKEEILDIEKTICFLGAVIVSIIISRKIVLFKDLSIITNYIPKNIDILFNKHPFISLAVVLSVVTSIIYGVLCLIIRLINAITIEPILKGIYNFGQKRSNFGKRVLGAILQVPKAIAYVVLCTIILNFGTMIYNDDKLNSYLQKSDTYNYVCDKVVLPIYNSSFAKNIPIIVNNTLNVEEIKDKSNIKKIIYYNGITLDEGIKSNKEINDFSKKLTANATNEKTKAKLIYDWIGSNINYDYQKADEIMRSNYENKSGAIPTFSSREGICFDYSCLYTAMARASGLKVRMISGKGFNGTSWVNHSWNQVYLEESNGWINIDSTFSKSGNYFDSKRFNMDHKNDEIIGEW